MINAKQKFALGERVFVEGNDSPATITMYRPGDNHYSFAKANGHTFLENNNPTLWFPENMLKRASE